MNHTNIIIILSSVFLIALFLTSVFVNLEVKNAHEELDRINKEINSFLLEIERKEIEIAALTSPANVFEYIEKKKLKPVSINNIERLIIKK